MASLDSEVHAVAGKGVFFYNFLDEGSKKWNRAHLLKPTISLAQILPLSHNLQ